MSVSTDLDTLRRHSRWLARLTLGLLVATSLIIAIPLVVGFAKSELTAPMLWEPVLRWSPSLCYLVGLWAISQGFRSFARGGLFGPATADGCSRAGVALAIGATLSAVGVPNLARLLAAEGLLTNTYWPLAYLVFDTAYLAVGVVGLALILLGRLLRRASELQAEASALRHELNEFF